MDNKVFVGVDIGGTKCAITIGLPKDGDLDIKDKKSFPTIDVEGTIESIKATIREVLGRNGLTEKDIQAIGISCGGPLDSKTGVILFTGLVNDLKD